MRISNDNSILKTLPPVLSSLVAGILFALPGFVDRAETMREVGNGLVSASASAGERVLAVAFQLGGWGFADAFRLVFAAVPWWLGFLILFWAVGRLDDPLRKWGLGVVWLLCLGASATGILETIFPASLPIRDPRLLAPLALVKMAEREPGRVFMNPSAPPCVAPFAAGLIDRSLPEKRAADLASSPEKWRAEDRSKPFSAVLIAGRVAEAKPLIGHLIDAPDWYLARIDNQGMLFLRGQKPDLSATPVPEFESPRDRAVYLAQYALNLDMAGFKRFASSSMGEALNLAGKDYEVLYRASSLSASLGVWERARKQAAAAVKVRPESYEANYLLGVSLLETRAFEKAFECTSQLRKNYPDDAGVLLLHARTCRAVHDYSRETKTLERLLELAEANHSPTARIHILLAQSWAQRGFPDQAVSHYQAALGDGLSDSEARDIRAALGTIEENRLKR